MTRTVFLVLVISAVASFTGCVGLIVAIPAECKNEAPTTKVHDIFWLDPEENFPPTPTKSDFLKEWGTPEHIETASANKETWSYTRSLWCGIVPVFFLPVPLMLPVCDGYDYVYFRHDNARLIHTRRIVFGGLILTIAGPIGGGDPECRYQIPVPVSEKIDAEKCLALTISIENPEHSTDKNYLKAALLIQDRITDKLINDGIAADVVQPDTYSDYHMNIIIKDVQAKHKNIFGFYTEINRITITVTVKNKLKNILIAEFDVKEPPTFKKNNVDISMEDVVKNTVNQVIKILKDE